MDKHTLLVNRRRFLSGLAFSAAAGATLVPWRGSAYAAAPKFTSDPFSLGVASGDPSQEGFVLWTRLAPNPLEVQAFTQELVEVNVEVATDPTFKNIVRRQTEIARPDMAHSVHAEIYGLAPNRQYFYRFNCGGVASPVGRVKTTPMLGADFDKLKFAWTSCAHYEQGYYTGYADIADQNPDLILGLGDYIYEVSYGPQLRRMPVNEAFTLDDYRLIHALTKTDKDLQRAHQVAPWLFIWDDHEVANDYQGDFGETRPVNDEKRFVERKYNAYKAFFEHIPLRSRSRFDASNHMRIYGQSIYGNLVEFTLLDTRQYRARAACPTPGRFEAEVVSRATCTELQDQNRTILGAAQERFVNENMMRGIAKWDILVQPTLFSTIFQKTSKGEDGAFNEGWSGFEPARQKLIDAIQKRQKQAQCVVIGGDMHAFFASDVKANYADQKSETVAVEFVGGSITSKSYNYDRFMKMLPDNPHIKFFDDRVNGYGLVEVDKQKMDVKLRATPSTWDKSAKYFNLKHYVVERGANRLNEV